MKNFSKMLFATGILSLATSVHAGLIPVLETFGFTADALSKLTDLSGTDDGAGAGYDATDPTTWNENGSSWNDMSFDDNLSGATNSKVGWYAFDLGSPSQPLDTIYVMNGYYLNGSESLSMDQFNVYYADTPTVTLSNGGDYDFSSGGWTQLGGLNTIANSQDTAFAVDASSVTARYIGIEMMRDHATSDIRVGMNEFAVTAIPEPSSSSFALLGLGLGALFLARRRK